MALRKDRLKELVKLLKDLDKKVKKSDKVAFEMAHWLRVSPVANDEEPEIKIKDGKVCVGVKEGFCNTSACVLGHAALHAPFQRLGLNVTLDFPEVLSEGQATGGSVVYKSHGRSYEGMDAGKVFFGLTEDQASDLFGGPFETPKEAAKWIEQNLLK